MAEYIVGEGLILLRRIYNKSLTEVVDKLGMSKTTYGRLERNQKLANGTQIDLIAKLYDLSADELHMVNNAASNYGPKLIINHILTIEDHLDKRIFNFNIEDVPFARQVQKRIPAWISDRVSNFIHKNQNI